MATPRSRCVRRTSPRHRDRAGYATGTFNALAGIQTTNAMDVVGEYNGSFLDKKLLLDIRGGWHNQKNDGLPGDGSGFDAQQPVGARRRLRRPQPAPTVELTNYDNVAPGVGDRLRLHHARPALPGGELLLRRHRASSTRSSSTATRAVASSPTW